MNYIISETSYIIYTFNYFENINTGTFVVYVNSADLLGKNILSKKPFSLLVNMINNSGFDFLTYFVILSTSESSILFF